jgi:hypothetical protein
MWQGDARTRIVAAVGAGLSRASTQAGNQLKQAIRVANVPKEEIACRA